MNHGLKLHPDGTLEITMPKGKKVTRVLVCEARTQNGKLFYPENDVPDINDGNIVGRQFAEQIIRCTNCRFFKRNIPCVDGNYNGCEMWLDDGNEIRVMTDDYCSKALPKEGEQE